MNILQELQARFDVALESFATDRAALLDMIRPAQDAKFGDYQANFAMTLAKTLGRPKDARAVAQEVAAQARLDDLCTSVEIAGPGFINLRLKDEWIENQLASAIGGNRLGVAPVASSRTYVVDYSSPNVAKPMHVGHIRSTVIGDALYRMLAFAGHKTISDNHLGDWGTQFGMIIYGFKHFADRAAYERSPVAELSRLYKLVHKLVDSHETMAALPKLREQLDAKSKELARIDTLPPAANKEELKQRDKMSQKIASQLNAIGDQLSAIEQKLDQLSSDGAFSRLVDEHADIQNAVLAETAKLHEGDAENLRLWREFLPACRDEIQRIYGRLGVRFDYELGESFYHDQLGEIVAEFEQRSLARESDGATCVFMPGFDTPMIIRKKDGAFLYSTTDLATIKYRMEHWRPDAMIYVVDHRQGEHFDKLFAAARLWGYDRVELKHVGFGTVLGEDGRPYKTRSGDTIGLEGLLDEAISRALKIVSDNDDAKPAGPELSADERRAIAEVVGIGGLKYIDLSQNRETDYTFSYDKMLALKGNTATYLQYCYARVRSIFRKGAVDIETLRNQAGGIKLEHPLERAIAVDLLRLGEVLNVALADYRPNLLTNYLFEIAQRFFTFYDQCPVLEAETETARTTRLLLSDMIGRTVKKGLELLGIGTVEKM